MYSNRGVFRRRELFGGTFRLARWESFVSPVWIWAEVLASRCTYILKFGRTCGANISDRTGTIKVNSPSNQSSITVGSGLLLRLPSSPSCGWGRSFAFKVSAGVVFSQWDDVYLMARLPEINSLKKAKIDRTDPQMLPSLSPWGSLTIPWLLRLEGN
jgi:hypothetical protein